MTSWEADALAMARALGTLDATLVAMRLMARDVLRNEHRELTPHIGLLETDPAAAFRHCVNSARTPGADPPSVVLGRVPVSTSGSAWRSLAVNALSAQAAWPQLDLTRMSSLTSVTCDDL